MSYKFWVFNEYSKDNSKLEAAIKCGRLVLMRGYYDFKREGFYIRWILKQSDKHSVMKFLYKSLDRHCWEYSGNYDNKLYEEWLREHIVFNRLSYERN